MKIAIVQGTRPEIIKNYSIVQALRAEGIPHIVMHTNQHRSYEMCGKIYEQMRYSPQLSMPGQYRIGRAIEWIQRALVANGVTQVLVNGDTAASIAGALAAMYLDIDVAHVEAGLRSGDRNMLEERNRIMVDVIATSLFAYTTVEAQLLRACAEVRGVVYLEGNTTVDVIHDYRHELTTRPTDSDYVFVTMHRKEFTDSKCRMEMVLEVLASIAQKTVRVIFSTHPRTKDAAERSGLRLANYQAIDFVDPLPVVDALRYEKHARAIVTDSGCIQEEAYLLGVRCVTVRENTERQLTVVHGANVVTGFDRQRIYEEIISALHQPVGELPKIYGTPGAGRRIADRIVGAACGGRLNPSPVAIAPARPAATFCEAG